MTADPRRAVRRYITEDAKLQQSLARPEFDVQTLYSPDGSEAMTCTSRDINGFEQYAEIGVPGESFTDREEWEIFVTWMNDEAGAVDASAPQNTTPRFVLCVGPIQEAFPDIPDAVAGSVVLWDRQEKREVLRVSPRYQQLICLETTVSKPFTDLEAWLNSLPNDALASEHVPTTTGPVGKAPQDATEATDEAIMQRAVELLADLGASFEYPGFISITVGKVNFAFGDIEGPWAGDYGHVDDDSRRNGCDEALHKGATAEELAQFIRDQIKAVGSI